VEQFRKCAVLGGRRGQADSALASRRSIDTTLEEGLRCPNGMAWSPDDRLMYLCDTWVRRIFVYDFDADDGALRNRRLFAEMKENEGFPDGLTVDADGCIWNAHYSGWRITRYAPDGKVDRMIRMPVQYVTSLTFGGPDLGTLYVTSGHLRLSDEERGRQPIAGHVFACEPRVRGIAEPQFAG
jgi:sugar lactone lactonase YvrE